MLLIGNRTKKAYKLNFDQFIYIIKNITLNNKTDNMIRTITSTGLILVFIGLAQAQDGGFLGDNQDRMLAANTTTTATSTTNTTTVKTATS